MKQRKQPTYVRGIKMEDLILVKLSKEIEKNIWEYRQEYFDSGETNINGV